VEDPVAIHVADGDGIVERDRLHRLAKAAFEHVILSVQTQIELE